MTDQILLQHLQQCQGTEGKKKIFLQLVPLHDYKHTITSTLPLTIKIDVVNLGLQLKQKHTCLISC